MATITATVNDGREQTNSEASLVFTVTVEAKAPPTIESHDTAVTVKAGREQTIMATVSDANTNDALTLSLTAADTNQDIVEVVTASVAVPTNGSARRDAQTLRIKGLKAGMVTLNLTVSDGDTTSEVSRVTVTVEANAQPTITSTFPTNISLLEGNSTTLNVVVADEDSDNLSIKLDFSDDMIATATITTRGATRTLKITGVGAGMATITATVNDGREQTNSEASLVFTVTVEAKAPPTIESHDTAVTVKAGREQTIMATVSDANTNDALTLSLTAADTNQDIVEVVTASVAVPTNGSARRDAQTLRIKGLKAGMATLNLTVSDGDTTSEVSRVTVTVEANAQPTITSTFPTNISLLEGNSTTLNVVVADEDSDNLSVKLDFSDDMIATATITTRGATRTLKITGIGAGMATITATVNDGREQTNSEASLVFTVTVEAKAPPTIESHDTAVTVKAGREQTIMATVSDANTNDALTLSLTAADTNQDIVEVVTASVAVPTNGSARRDAQTLRIKGLKAGMATLNLTVSDGDTTSEVSRVTVTVEANAQPTITSTFPTNISLLEGNSTTLNVVVADEDSDDLSIKLDFSDDMIATATITTRDETHVLTITGVSAGMATITTTVNDGREQTNSEASLVFTVTVEAKAPPTIESHDTAVTVKAGREQTIMATVSDANTNDALTLSLTAADTNQDIVEVVTASVAVPTNGSARRDAQTLRIKGLKAGMATLNLTVSDGDTTSEVSRVTVTVEANAQPTITSTFPTNISLLEGNSTTLNVVVADEDSDNLSIKLDFSDDMIATATITTRGATRTLKITGVGAGMATITATVNDGREQTNSEASLVFTVTVEAKAPPMIESHDTAVTVKAGREQTIMATVSDANTNDALTLSLTAADTNQDIVEVVTASVAVPTNGSARRDAQTLRIKGLKAGMVTLNLTVSDGDTTSEVSRVTVTVEANAQPTITSTFPTNISLLEGNSTTLNVVVADEDSDNLSIKLDFSDDMIATATITTRGATRTLKITGVSAGMATITATVNDGREQTNSEASLVFTVTVEANAVPTITINSSPSQAIKPKITASIVVRVSDENYDVGDLVTVRAVSSTPSVVTVAPLRIAGIADDTNRTFTLTAAQAGNATIQFTATDSRDASTSTSVSVRVNTPPSVVVANVTTPVATVGEAFTLKTSEFFEDADKDILIYSITTSSIVPKSLADRLAFSTTGTLTFTPQATEASTSTSAVGRTVTVSVSDGRGSSATATFTLLINAAPTGGVSLSVDSVNKWLLRAESTVMDDANGGIVSTTYQWYIGRSQLGGEIGTTEDILIDSATGNTYMIPDTPTGRAAGTSYRVEVTFEDNIGQSETFSTQHIVVNEKPFIKEITTTPTKAYEGSTQNIIVIASDENYDDLTYLWRVVSGADRVLTNVNTNSAILDFPTDLVVGDATTTTTLKLEVTVSDKYRSTATETILVIVNKVNNGMVSGVRLGRNNQRTLTLLSIDWSREPDGGVGRNVAYQWQQCLGGADCLWADIKGAKGTSYTVPDLMNDNDRFRVKLEYTDGQGYDNIAYSSSRGPSDIKIRSKVFLEGPLQ